eukprot:330607-Amphidinium_carterae.1
MGSNDLKGELLADPCEVLQAHLQSAECASSCAITQVTPERIPDSDEGLRIPFHTMLPLRCGPKAKTTKAKQTTKQLSKKTKRLSIWGTCHNTTKSRMSRHMRHQRRHCVVCILLTLLFCCVRWSLGRYSVIGYSMLCSGGSENSGGAAEGLSPHLAPQEDSQAHAKDHDKNRRFVLNRIHTCPSKAVRLKATCSTVRHKI